MKIGLVKQKSWLVAFSKRLANRIALMQRQQGPLFIKIGLNLAFERVNLTGASRKRWSEL